MNNKQQSELQKLLLEYLSLFKEMRELQAQVNQAIGMANHTLISKCKDKENIISEKIRSVNVLLKPLLQIWSNVDVGLKKKMLSERLGKIIGEIEEIAQEINNVHESIFPSPPTLSDDKLEKISNKINLYR